MYRVLLLSTMEVHPVFQVTLLKRVAEDLLEGQMMPPQPPVEDKMKGKYKSS